MTIGVDVESDAPASVTNIARVAGGGDVNGSNNTAEDPTQINRGQDLTVSKSHSTDFIQGQRGVPYTPHRDQHRRGADDRHGDAGRYRPGWPGSDGGQRNLLDLLGLRPDLRLLPKRPSARGSSYEPITITVDVARDAPAAITNRAVVAGGGDVFSANNNAEDLRAVDLGPDLTLVKAHTGVAVPGRAVTFVLTPTNTGGVATQGSSTWSTCCLSG